MAGKPFANYRRVNGVKTDEIMSWSVRFGPAKKRESDTFETETAAWAFKAAVEANGEKVPKDFVATSIGPVLFDAIALEYIENQTNASPVVKRQYLTSYRQHVQPDLGHLPIGGPGEITAQTIIDWQQKMKGKRVSCKRKPCTDIGRCDPALGHPLKKFIDNATINRIMFSIVAPVFDYAMQPSLDGTRPPYRDPVNSQNPCYNRAVGDGRKGRYGKGGKLPVRKKAKVQLESPRDAAILIDALYEMDRLHNLDIADMVITALATGMRFGEFVALTKSSLYVDSCEIEVYQTMARDGDGRPYLRDEESAELEDSAQIAKSEESSFRRVPVPEALMQRLVERSKTLGPDDFLFVGSSVTSYTLGMWSQSRYHRWWMRILDLAVANGFRRYMKSHNLRGSLITWLSQSGIDVLSVMRLAGHKNVSTTQGYANPNGRNSSGIQQAQEVLISGFVRAQLIHGDATTM